MLINILLHSRTDPRAGVCSCFQIWILLIFQTHETRFCFRYSFFLPNLKFMSVLIVCPSQQLCVTHNKLELMFCVVFSSLSPRSGRSTHERLQPKALNTRTRLGDTGLLTMQQASDSDAQHRLTLQTSGFGCFSSCMFIAAT